MIRTFTALLVFTLFALPAAAHCDRADGPVVAEGRAALESGAIEGALKWVGPDQEKELRESFALAREARTASEPARQIADRFFLETLVRLHRAMEGEPYDGIKWDAAPLPPAIVHADRALEEEKLGNLGEHLGSAAMKGVEARFAKAVEAKRHAGESIEAGRHFTAAYAEYVRYVEMLDAAIKAEAHGH